MPGWEKAQIVSSSFRKRASNSFNERLCDSCSFVCVCVTHTASSPRRQPGDPSATTQSLYGPDHRRSARKDAKGQCNAPDWTRPSHPRNHLKPSGSLPTLGRRGAAAVTRMGAVVRAKEIKREPLQCQNRRGKLSKKRARKSILRRVFE